MNQIWQIGTEIWFQTDKKCGRTDDAKTISLRLRRGKNWRWSPLISTSSELNALKTIFDHYYCIISTIYNSPNCTKSRAPYFYIVSQSPGGWTFSLIFLFKVKPYIRAIQESSVVKCSGLEWVYLRYQILALTACELPCKYMTLYGWKLTIESVRHRFYEINWGYYMHAHVLLKLLNELRKSDKMWGLPSILSLFRNKFHKFNNTGTWMFDSISSYNIKTTLKFHFWSKKL